MWGHDSPKLNVKRNKKITEIYKGVMKVFGMTKKPIEKKKKKKFWSNFGKWVGLITFQHPPHIYPLSCQNSTFDVSLYPYLGFTSLSFYNN